MEVKKTKKADLEGEKGTGLLIGYIVGLALMFACFEYTTREYKENDVVYAPVVQYSAEEIQPIEDNVFPEVPQQQAPEEVPDDVADIIEEVDDDQKIEEKEIESTEDTNNAVQGPPVQHTGGSTMVGPPAPIQEESDENEIFEAVEKMPSFPGGDAALMKYLNKSLKYPASAQENGIQGRVMVQFVVNKDGSIVEPRILRSVDPALDKEAMRVVQAMPKWNAGQQGGKPVRVKFTLPVTFRLQN